MNKALPHKVLITGSSKGLGKATAELLLLNRCQVIHVARDLSVLEGNPHFKDKSKNYFLSCDLSLKNIAVTLFEKAWSAFDGIDTIIHNAASIGQVANTVNCTEESIEKTFDCNFFNIWRINNLFLRRATSGGIIHVLSGFGEKVQSPLTLYSLTKASLLQYTQLLIQENRKTAFRIYGFDPGGMRTNMQNFLREIPEESIGKKLHAYFQVVNESEMLCDPILSAKHIVDFTLDLAGKHRGKILSTKELQMS